MDVTLISFAEIITTHPVIIIPLIFASVVALLDIIFSAYPSFKEQLAEATDEDEKTQMRSTKAILIMRAVGIIFGLFFLVWVLLDSQN